MNNIRPTALTDNPQSGWKNLVSRTINAHNVVAGQGVHVNDNGSHGMSISVEEEIMSDHMVWRGNFNQSYEYKPMDVVRVVEGKYKDEVGADIPIGFTSTPGLGITPISLGLFVCTTYVPPSFADQNWFKTNIVPKFTNNFIPGRYQQGTRWYDYNVYYPVFPEPTPSSSVALSYGFNVTKNNTFWQAMPFGAAPMKACVDGVTADYYVICQKKGGVFLPEYLPV